MKSPQPKDKIIFVGGGLANTLIALRLRALRPEIPFEIVEASHRFGGEHTWSFHESDLDASSLPWMAGLVSHRWSEYEVIFSRYRRKIPLAYGSIRCAPTVPAALDFHHRILPILGPWTRFGQKVVKIGTNWAVSEDGTRYEGALVIDGRGPLGEESPGPMALHRGYQKFFGLVVSTDRPHGISHPIVMDTRVSQKNGYRFIYTLPFTDRTLLIEDTYYHLDPKIHREAMIGDLLDYGEKHLGLKWSRSVLEHFKAQGVKVPPSSETALAENPSHVEVKEPPLEESGVLPIPLTNHPSMPSGHGVIQSGLRAGLFNPTTSYSLGQGVSFAQFFASTWDPDQRDRSVQRILDHQHHHWSQGGFFRRLNNMLFLAAKPEKRVQVFEHFYQKDIDLIKNFYRGHLRLVDQLSLLSGRPPVPVMAGLRSFIKARSWPTPGEREVHAP